MKKKEFIEYFKSNGKTDSWENLAIEFGFPSKESLRCWFKRNKKLFDVSKINYTEDKLNSFRESRVVVKNKVRILDNKPVRLLEEEITYKPVKVDYVEQFKDFVSTYTPLKDLDKNLMVKPVNYEFKKESGKSLLINIFDLHLAKFAWGVETGEDYDINIAKQRFLSSIKSLVTKAVVLYDLDEIVLCNGGDFIHFDNKHSTTTAGTYVESDSRYQKVFKEALQLLTDSILFLKEYGKKVKFINIQGNHDEHISYYLGVALEAVFRNDDDVIIDNTPKIRKYHKFGNTLIMFTHGDKRPEALPLTFAVESKEFSNAKFRYIFLGHLHKGSKKYFMGEDEFNGIVVRTFNSICGTDSYHNDYSFINSNKIATSIIYDLDEGPIAENYKRIF